MANFIEIGGDTKVVESSGVGARGPWKILRQTDVWFWVEGKRYPTEVSLSLRVGRNGEPDQVSYAPGRYTVDWDASVYVGEYDRLQVSQDLVLVPMTSSGAARTPKAAE